jgi:hypothetical protein
MIELVLASQTSDPQQQRSNIATESTQSEQQKKKRRRKRKSKGMSKNRVNNRSRTPHSCKKKESHGSRTHDTTNRGEMSTRKKSCKNLP